MIRFSKFGKKVIDIMCFEIHFIEGIDLVNIGIDTKITEIGTFIAKL